MSGPQDHKLIRKAARDEAFDLALYVRVTVLLSFMSGMEVRSRVLQNLLLVSAAVVVTYGLGTLVKHFWQVAV